MTWHATFLLIDVAMLVALFHLYNGAPGWMQKSALVWMWFGFLFLACGRGAALDGQMNIAFDLLEIGRTTVVIGVMAYVFRLWIAEQERRCLPKSSLRSPSSGR